MARSATGPITSASWRVRGATCRRLRSCVSRAAGIPSAQGSEVFVLDTNTVLDYFKGKGRVPERLLATPPTDIALPAISAYEVWVGVLGSQNPKRRREQFEAFLSAIEILPFDAEAGVRAAELRHYLER